MEMNVVKEEPGMLELEFEGKEVALAILSVFKAKKVDAYVYEPHPLKPGFRLHIESKNPRKEVEAAAKSIDKQLSSLSKKIDSATQ